MIASSDTLSDESGPDPAQDFARRLLRPRALDIGLRSGVFLSRQLPLHDQLVSALESHGALVLSVSIDGEGLATPHERVRSAVSRELERQGRPRIEPYEDGATLAVMLQMLVDQAMADTVLILEPIEYVCAEEPGQSLLRALKSARDAINLQQNAKRHFLFIGVGSDHALLKKLVTGSDQAFLGATFIDS